MAQLVARFVRNEEVGGSNPPGSTVYGDFCLPARSSLTLIPNASIFGVGFSAVIGARAGAFANECSQCRTGCAAATLVAQSCVWVTGERENARRFRLLGRGPGRRASVRISASVRGRNSGVLGSPPRSDPRLSGRRQRPGRIVRAAPSCCPCQETLWLPAASMRGIPRVLQ